MEVIDLGGFDNLEPISLNFSGDDNMNSSSSSSQKVNFGSGIELLMNDKVRSSSGGDKSFHLSDLDTLEEELNRLSDDKNTNNNNTDTTKTISGIASNFFNLGGFMSGDKNEDPSSKKVEGFDDGSTSTSNIGNATRGSIGVTKTWDGYSKMNEVPQSSGNVPNVSDREKRRKKRLMIKKLEEWYEKGFLKHNSHFTIDSSYEEIEDEYESALEDKRKKDSMKLQGWWFMTFINSMEYANAVFNPFDLNLDGWGEQVSEDIDSYEEIFSELHDKYKGGKLAPEISLLLRVAFSAAVLNFSNKALSSATPAFNDVIKQSPELMRMFTNATVSSMSQQSPGFAMANNMMQEQSNRPRGPPPPAPVETKTQPPPQRPGMTFTETQSNRPDIAMGRGAMFREPGIELNNNANYNSQPPPPLQQTQQPIPNFQRPEMKGPQNTYIDSILSGLKTRNIDIHEDGQEGDSVMSVSSMKDLQNSNLPKKAYRKKNKSDKNTISLDI